MLDIIPIYATLCIGERDAASLAGDRRGGGEMKEEKMTLTQAQEILTHLIKTGQGFCFLVTGELISRTDCWERIRQATAI